MKKSSNKYDKNFIEGILAGQCLHKDFNIVFGVDHILYFPSNEEKEIDISYFANNVIHLQKSQGWFEYSYFFYPNFGELFLEILSWGWNIKFYSCQEHVIDWDIIRSFFLKFLRRYMSEPVRLYDKLVLEGRVSIFTSDGLVPTFTCLDLQTGFDIDCLYKINLDKMGCDPKNSIIIDHNRPLIPGANYPYIGMDKNASVNFSLYFEMILEKLELGATTFPKEYLEQDYSPLNNAFYIMGILSKAKYHLDLGKAHFLQQAIDKILYNEEYYKNQDITSIYDTPWYLSPLPHINPKSEEFIKHGKYVLDKWDEEIEVAS